ncbi:MAG TPA: TIR domain-containing protein [Thermodesulfobacteriota bacterium]
MNSSSTQLLSFPNEFPTARVGILLPEQDILITGHNNGYVVRWDLASKQYEILHQCASPVETLSKSAKNEIAVGCNSGLLFTFNLTRPNEQNIIQEAAHTKATRVWRSTWVSADSLLVSSTYGVLNLFEGKGSIWQKSSLGGHGDSIFGLEGSNDRLVASGDWIGKIIIRQYVDGQYLELDRLKIGAAVEGISWQRDNSFATIDQLGHISFFEPAMESPDWKLVYETDTASSRGTCVLLTEDGRTIFAGTHTEVIQFDVDTQQVQIIAIENTKAIFSKGDTILILTANGLRSFQRTKIIVPEEAVKYQYCKVSLIGHTGAGKTTLCSLITSGTTNDIKSTAGKRVWNWTLPQTQGSPDRRIVFHDHGGQETVLDTFLPFLADSDVVLIFFQKIDKTTFEKALQILEELESLVTAKTKIFFVETFIDHDVDEINRVKLNDLIKGGKILACLEVSPSARLGIDEFKQRLTETIDWKTTRTMIRSEHVESLERSISALIAEKTTVLPFTKLKQFHESNSNRSITTNHLRFLLANFSSQGSIEYYPDVLDSIIFNDERYNDLRSKIPIVVEQKSGIISINEIQNQFGQPDYVRMIDQVYLSYGVAIENDDLRIFPSKLKQSISSIPDAYKKLLGPPRYEGQVDFPLRNIKGGRLLKALSELKLKCIDASKKEGFFAWERNACLYYKCEEVGDALKGYDLRVSYKIGGEKESICNRLNTEFQDIIERLYGPHLIDPDTVKKKDLNKSKYDVALSFAGEQREYVFQVATTLESKGVKVFYDEFKQSHLWGKDLAEYLQTVYYSDSSWCIMFISKEYVAKAWPTHERKNAIAKEVKVRGRYILPVRFDTTEVPGLNPSISYQDAQKKSPQEIALLFLEKFEKETPPP